MLKVGFIGAGRIAHALAKGFISAGVTKGEHIIASCAPDDKLNVTTFEKLGAKITFENTEVIKDRDVVVIATKPDVVPTVLKQVANTVSVKSLFVSVAMGVPIKKFEEILPKGTRVIRVMANTPVLVLTGASVFVRGSNSTEEDVKVTKRLFEAVGTCEEVPEYFIDAVTGLSGSGPAYVYIFIEALADGAVRMGLPRDLAYRLAAQTVIGAGKMVLDTKQHPGLLKDNVTSPAGSTAAGIYVLEKNGLRAAVIEALEAATNKSKEMSRAENK
uniref:Pyrroline-5-carboxylate reductase n=1 Tax=Clastoptera arizonana TaxID=38151 RepID=A0A1B6E9L7_9HEMI